MAKEFVLNVKLDADDEDRLVWLARRVKRTKADTVRWLISEATGGPRMPDKRAPFSYVHPEPLGITGDWEEWGAEPAGGRQTADHRRQPAGGTQGEVVP